VPPGGTPYWAHVWPGGLALAQHLTEHPQSVDGRSVVEIGAGSGLVSLAALRAGAEAALATDTDPLAAVAVRVNAEANGLISPQVHVSSPSHLASDLGGLRRTSGTSIILAGDVFYDPSVAAWASAALDAAWDALGRETPILIGDIGRRFLPRDRIEPLASYPVRDVGDPPGAPPREGWVFRWRAPS
jgi:predicted nicotinamide N-methyase